MADYQQIMQATKLLKDLDGPITVKKRRVEKYLRNNGFSRVEAMTIVSKAAENLEDRPAQ